jgi:SAM-dependent methyltransferase
MSTEHITAGQLYVDGSYATANPDWHEGDSAWKAARLLEMMKKHQIDPHSVCEVGCGAGQILRCLQEKLSSHAVFTGFEPSPQAFLMAQKKENTRLRFVNSSAPTDGKFDVVLLIDVFEHVEDCFTFLRNLRTLGKTFIFHIPLDLSVFSVAREWPLIKRRRSVGHIHYFTKATALALLEETGYRIIDRIYTEIRRPGEGLALSTLLGRRLPQSVCSALGFKDLAVRVFGDHSLLVLASSTRRATVHT